MIAVIALVALLSAGCNKQKGKETLLPFAYTEHGVSEQYEAGDRKNAGYALGIGAEVCVPAIGIENNDNTDFVYGLYHVSEREVLLQNRIMDKIYPASVTKLMTTLLAMKYCDLNETVTISYNASHIGVYGAMLCGFKEGDKIVLKDLLTAFLIASGNDAGIAVAEHVSGSVEEFAKLMNEEALRLGAVDTHFTNPHGLHDKNHYTTAYDMYLVLNKLIQDEDFLSIISNAVCDIVYTDKNGNEVTNNYESTNLFLNGTFKVPEGIEIIGGKTGTTNAAGCCLVLYFKDLKGNYYIAEVFHAPTYETLYGTMTDLMLKAISH